MVRLFEVLSGAGPVLAPRLLAAFGDDRSRYPTTEDVQRYSGIAPVLKRSGNQAWVHWRYCCPTFLRQTFVEWAGETVKLSFWANA
ncbi:MAG: transposase [Gammaproteobacteria bacterium]|jgi:transposase